VQGALGSCQCVHLLPGDPVISASPLTGIRKEIRVNLETFDGGAVDAAANHDHYLYDLRPDQSREWTPMDTNEIT
jgi:hypothetical protein